VSSKRSLGRERDRSPGPDSQRKRVEDSRELKQKLLALSLAEALRGGPSRWSFASREEKLEALRLRWRRP
jgi:hypothetical protein